MRRHRTLKAAMLAATIATAVAVPIGTASAATTSPMVHTSVDEGAKVNQAACDSYGQTFLNDGADSYSCVPNPDGTYELWTYWS